MMPEPWMSVVIGQGQAADTLIDVGRAAAARSGQRDGAPALSVALAPNSRSALVPLPPFNWMLPLLVIVPSKVVCAARVAGIGAIDGHRAPLVLPSRTAVFPATVPSVPPLLFSVPPWMSVPAYSWTVLPLLAVMLAPAVVDRDSVDLQDAAVGGFQQAVRVGQATRHVFKKQRLAR